MSTDAYFQTFLLLGSNEGDRQLLLQQAVSLIGELAGEVVRCSALYETSPWAMEGASSFLNQVLELKTPLEPLSLLNLLQEIEHRLGRTQKSQQPKTIRDPGSGIPDAGCGINSSVPLCLCASVPSINSQSKRSGDPASAGQPAAYTSRTMDIDILYCGRMVMNTPELCIPHPLIPFRRFVLVPMAEIAPEFVDPVSERTVGELLDRCEDPGTVVRVQER